MFVLITGCRWIDLPANMVPNHRQIEDFKISNKKDDSTRFIDIMENISEYLDDDSIKEIVSVYADKGYDAKYIRNYLRNNGMTCCIPYKNNSKFIVPDNIQSSYNKTRFVVERFFAWLKNGFHRTTIAKRQSS